MAGVTEGATVDTREAGGWEEGRKVEGGLGGGERQVGWQGAVGTVDTREAGGWEEGRKVEGGLGGGERQAG